jgi:spore maturation protein CgeB
MLASYIDFKTLRSSWKKKFAAPVRNAMEEVAEQVCSDVEVPYYQAFVAALDKQLGKGGGIDPDKVNFIEVLSELELYVRGYDRFSLVSAIKDAKIDLFGAKDQGADWKKALGKQSNVVFHDPVPYDQVLSIMKHSKIILNSSPWIKEGGHERIFSALASGALPFTNENRYLSKQFKDGESIVFYHPNRLDKTNHRVNEYLANEPKRENVVLKGREIVMGLHTWDRRVEQLLLELPPLLKQIGK